MNARGVAAAAIGAFLLLSLSGSVGSPRAEEPSSRRQLEEKYRSCFHPGRELDNIVAKELALDELKRVDGVKAGPYKVKELVKDDPLGDAACDKLPGFLQAICWGRTLGKYADELVRQPTLNKELTRQYVRYLKIEVGECKEGYQPQDPRTFVKMPSGLGKGVGTAVSAFKKGAAAYCVRIREVRGEIEQLRNYCTPVPDLKGKTYGGAKDYLSTGLPEKERFSADLLVLKDGKTIRYPSEETAFQGVKNLKVVGQEPVPGVLVDRRDTNLAVELEPNVPEKLVLTSPGKPLLSPGGELRVKVEATFANGEVRDVTDSPDCRWKGSGASILRIEKGIVTLEKPIDKEGIVSLIAVYAVGTHAVESSSLEVEVAKVREAVGVRLELLESNVIDYADYNSGKKVRLTRIFSDGTEDVVPENDIDGEKCGFASRTAGVYVWSSELMIEELPADLPNKEIVVFAYCRDGSGSLLESNKVSLFVKEGLVIIPRVYDKTETEARKMLLDAGLLVGDVHLYSTSNACERGVVPGNVAMSYEPPGMAVPPGTEIELALAGYRVPDLLGMSEADATQAFQGVDLDLSFLKPLRFYPGFPPEAVRAQKPDAGKCLMKGTKVVATLNGSPALVGIPDLIGKREAEAGDIVRPLSLLLDVKRAKKWVRGYDAGVVVDQDPPAGGGKPVNPGATIAVWLNPSLPSMGIDVIPDKRSYKVGESISFAENVEKTNPNNTYTFTWEKDGEFAAKDDSFTTTFDTPGRHYVQLILTSSDPDENDAIIRNVHIDYPPDLPDPTVDIAVSPGEPYTPGTKVTFSGNVTNLPDAGEFRWYVNGKDVGRGTSLPYSLGGKGKYEIILVLLRRSGDELKATKTITVGDEPIKPLGRWINKFDPLGTMADLKVCSSYWKGGYAYSQGIGAVVSEKPRWSKCTTFDRVGAVEGYDLYTGEQADTYNSGWVAYAPAGRNTLLFKVYGFRFGDPRKDQGAWNGYTGWKGSLDTHGTLVPSSIRFVKKQSRAGTVRWQTDDGKTCTARIHKFKSGGQGTITKNVFVAGGVDYEECVETGTVGDGYDPRDDPGMASPGSATAAGGSNPFVHQFQDGGSTGSGGASSGGSQGSAGNLSNVTVGRKNVTITFWDHGKEDGDIINIFLNGSLLQGGLKLKSEKRKFDVTLNSGSNTFEVEAVNEGSLPPNTASVRISDVTKGRGTQIYERQSGERASMNLFAP